MIRLHSAILVALAAIAAPAAAQVSLQGAHDQGIGFATEQKNSVGTSRINEQTAAQVPLYKPNAVQSGSYDGGFGDMMSIGVSRITESQAYTSGNCDKEGFDPEQAAQSVMGPAKWAALTPAQKQRAISDQVSFFDQECEGINFLAGEYQMRQKIEIPPSDDLNEWNPGGETDGNGQCSMQTITVPPEYQENSCYQTTALEKRECFDTANVNVYLKDGLPEAPYTQTIYNENSPVWTLTVYPAEGKIFVEGNTVYLGTRPPSPGNPLECLWAGSCNVYGYGSEWISMYGGQTSIWQPYLASEQFRVRSRPNNECVFRIDNWHYQGGAGSGPEDNHMTWTYNFCVPIKHVDVTWQDNCAILEAATDLPN